MATDDAPDPAADPTADFDYQSPDVSDPELVDALSERVDGEVRFDTYSRELYATDASAYEVTPIGVVFPRSTADVSAVMEYCAAEGVPVLPRGGGTSLAGQTVNEAVVLDFTREMDALLAVDPEGRTARAQPGAILGEVNAELAPHGLKFAPDPAWGDKSALGGAIGNNSTGSHSLKYGKTDAYLEEVEAVLADGTVTTFGEVTLAELAERADPEGDLEARVYAEIRRILDEEREEIEDKYPDLKRNVSGYNLDWLVEEAEGRSASNASEEGRPASEASEANERDGSDAESVNVARLLAGSEGTLAIVTEAEVALEPIPETKAVALLTYDDLLDAMRDVPPILEHDPAAVEVLDDVLLDLARETEEFGSVVGMLPEGTNSVLLVEFYAEDDARGRRKVADLVADRVPDAETEADPRADRTETGADRRAAAAMEAHDAATRQRFWKMRKSGLPILLGRTSDAKHIAFIEDTAIPPQHLAEYVAEFREILADHGTYASFYAHAGPGVLHIRPLIDTKTVEGIETMHAIADEVTDLVVKYDGSVSGEHGDGRARTQWNRKLYGEHLWGVFRDLKTAFDPDWLLNPGQVCGDVDMTQNLRFNPDYDFEAGFEADLVWENENGFQGMTELCHGCGGCRGSQAVTGGVMCPTYRAADEEITTTRGRANMLRQAMSGDVPDEEGVFSEEFVDEVLDLCIGCKGCAKDCPSEVDMAKLKVEVMNEYHDRHGASLRERFFAHVEPLARLGSKTAPVSNWLRDLPGADYLEREVLGLAPERDLPNFAGESLREWFADRGAAVDPDEAVRKALLVPDTYTNYVHPETGKAAVRVLEAADVHVQIPGQTTGSGRPPHSKGFVDLARERAERNVDALALPLENGWDAVLVEPSDAVMFQSDYLDLLTGRDVRTVAENTYGVMEYLDTFGLDPAADADADAHVDAGVAGADRLTYHGHCHQKATSKDHHTASVLADAGFEVDPLDSTCCGMAGSFGYEREHYSMSKAVGDILYDQVADSDGDRVVAPGTSCRTQIADETEVEHPVVVLAEAL
jgi:FAD/FMN-containing dehydrogenase/Fe-S oxidoreductase